MRSRRCKPHGQRNVRKVGGDPAVILDELKATLGKQQAAF